MCRRCCVLGELLADAGFCFAEAEALGIGDAGEVVVLEFFAADAVACGAFAADGTVGGFDGFDAAVEGVAAETVFADANGGGVRKEGAHERILVGFAADHVEEMAGAAFFHADRNGVDVEGAGGEKFIESVADGFAGHVVDVAAKLDNVVAGGAALAEQGAHAVGGGEIFFAHAVADGAGAHDRHAAKAIGEMFEQGGAGWRAELALNAAAIDRHVLEDGGGGWRRNGQNAMGAVYLAAADVHWRDDDLVGRETMHEQTDGGDVCDGIHGADFVEVDLAHWFAVGFAFGVGNEVVDGHDVVSDCGWQRKMAAHDVLDIVEAGVVVMAVRMVVMMCGRVIVVVIV